MKSIILGLTSILCLSLTACTSQEAGLKKQAQKLGEQKFAEVIQKEAEESLSQSDWLRQEYIQFIHRHSEVEIEEVQLQGENLGVVSLTVTTYPEKVRRTLLEIASKVDPSRSRRFNFSEAVSLIRRQTGQALEPDKQPLGVYKFKKAEKSWIAE